MVTIKSIVTQLVRVPRGVSTNGRPDETIGVSLVKVRLRRNRGWARRPPEGWAASLGYFGESTIIVDTVINAIWHRRSQAEDRHPSLLHKRWNQVIKDTPMPMPPSTSPLDLTGRFWVFPSCLLALHREIVPGPTHRLLPIARRSRRSGRSPPSAFAPSNQARVDPARE